MGAVHAAKGGCLIPFPQEIFALTDTSLVGVVLEHGQTLRHPTCSVRDIATRPIKVLYIAIGTGCASRVSIDVWACWAFLRGSESFGHSSDLTLWITLVRDAEVG